MNAHHLLAFLEVLIMDSEGAGEPIPDRDGFVQADFRWPEVDQEDRVLTVMNWDSPFAVTECDGNLAVYSVAVQAMIALRSYWRECAPSYVEMGGGQACEVLSYLASDVGQLISMLTHYENLLNRLMKGMGELQTAEAEDEADAQKARQSLERAQSTLRSKELKLAASQALIQAFGLMVRTPVEQLAALGEE